MNKALIPIILIVLSVVAISGCTSSNSAKTTSFSNQFVSFNYPDNLVVVDNSSKTNCQINIFNGTPTTGDDLDPNYVGDISTVDKDYLNTVTDSRGSVNLHGTSGVEYIDSSLNAYSIFIPKKSLLFELDLGQPDSSYDLIKNSLIIK